MESMIGQLFLHNWQRKLVALITAIVIWLFVNHSINATQTISNVPIRIINLPADKTIPGLLPNGILGRRIALTLTGSKDVVEQLEPGDLEVLLDASTADSDDWIVSVTKKNLVSLNPSIDLSQHISQVNHNEFVVKLSKLVAAKIPVTIDTPKGSPPQGYEYLDIWPQHLIQTISGPEEEVLKLKEAGLEISFDLAEITKADLDAIKSNARNDEISFIVPKKWKQLSIPFRHGFEELNDPEAQNLRIDFLRKELIPLDKEVPVRLFYPLEDLDKLNPERFTIATNDDIQKREGLAIFIKPLYAAEVSRLFMDVVRNSIEIVIVAAPKNKRKVLAWSVQFIQPRDLEDTYVAFSIANATTSKGSQGVISKKMEELLRKRFRDYMQRMTFYLSNNKKLHLKSTIEGDQIRIVAY